MNLYTGRVGIVQRVLPRYRAPFFDLLAQQCTGGLGVFAGAARPNEEIPLAEKLEVAKWTRAKNWHLFGGPFYLCVQRGLTEWLGQWEPDVLIVEANPRYLSTSAAIKVMKARLRPVIGWGLGAPKSPNLTAGVQNWWRKRFLRQFDALIAYSQRGAAEYRNLVVPSDRIFVASNAVLSKSAARRPHRAVKPANQCVLLYVGRLQKRKRIEALIQVCASLPTKLQPTLQIVGAGPTGDKLKKFAASVYPRTIFTGALFGAELEHAFDAADLFVLPGSGGLAIQQAMAHGLPVIAAKGEDGIKDDMVQPGNGRLLELGDDSALRQALVEALSDPERMSAMGKKSFDLVQREFNLENMVASFVAAINQVVA